MDEEGKQTVTIIALDANWNLAADGMQSVGDIITSTHERKIRKEGDTVYVFAGAVPMFDHLIAWHKAGAKPDDVPKAGKDNIWTMVAASIDRASGRVVVEQYNEDCPYVDFFDPPWAWGATQGKLIALGAMLAGKTAGEAVALACQHTSTAGGSIQVVNIAEALGAQKRDLGFARNPYCDRPECQTTLGCQCRREAAE